MTSIEEMHILLGMSERGETSVNTWSERKSDNGSISLLSSPISYYYTVSIQKVLALKENNVHIK